MEKVNLGVKLACLDIFLLLVFKKIFHVMSLKILAFFKNIKLKLRFFFLPHGTKEEERFSFSICLIIQVSFETNFRENLLNDSICHNFRFLS